MNVEEVLASFGLGGLVADEFFFTQIGILTLTGILFAGSLALCIMAMRAAFSAKRARNEAQLSVDSMQDLAVEMRQLTAQVERAAYAPSRDEDVDDKLDAEDVTSLDAEVEERNQESDDKAGLRKPSALLRGFLSRR